MFNSHISDYEMKARQDSIRREIEASKAAKLNSNRQSILEKVRAALVLLLAI